MTGHEPIDLAVIAELKDLMDDEFDTLITVYINDSNERMAALSAAIRLQDASQVWTVGHSFKGASSNLGAFPLTHLLQEMEDAGRNNQLDIAAILLPKVQQAYDQVVTILRGTL